jgi:hypothetical protein
MLEKGFFQVSGAEGSRKSEIPELFLVMDSL